MRQALGVILISVIAVVATDVTFKSTLLRTLWPVIVSPADGAITTTPVTVRWEGSQPLLVTLVGSGIREELGLRHSPFEIESRYFSRPGQYGVEIRSPILGSLASAERRFLVRPPKPHPTPVEAAPDLTATVRELNETVAKLQDERSELQGQTTNLSQENDTLRRENQELSAVVDELRASREQVDSRLAAIEAQQADLAREHRQALEENRFLRGRMESIPACTIWGYLAYPRPQTIPPTRRIVMVSNTRGEVFRGHGDCEAARRSDGTAASQCFCVGSPWQG